ncbi:TetR/AcrR family transcriptional regulator [Allonocardiopsis opalescens]|uniref:TetR family transcriptional regulator n=1 Tax=Allonocardiopsis opalescens TaxID=1144618 RepID=A0A2T0Q1M7_9ACTN|nr:TetR/AcrR family transcriptional regulator [Allonocardiopsis opalescens]PRX97706.1 TetR family transcriptional regulator [Allonocardiopsis opalescens]
MSTQQTESTRERILAAACELFAAHTYRAATMREIAERLGITKPSLYYHFSSKAEILESLIGTPIDELARAVDAAAAERDPAEAKRRVLRGCVDVIVTHRDTMRLLLRDASVYSDGSTRVVERVVATVDRAVDLLAGPGADWRARLRAAQAFAAATDPAAQFTDVPANELREELVAGAAAVIGLAPAAGGG